METTSAKRRWAMSAVVGGAFGGLPLLVLFLMSDSTWLRQLLRAELPLTILLYPLIISVAGALWGALIGSLICGVLVVTQVKGLRGIMLAITVAGLAGIITELLWFRVLEGGIITISTLIGAVTAIVQGVLRE